MKPIRTSVLDQDWHWAMSLDNKLIARLPIADLNEQEIKTALAELGREGLEARVVKNNLLGKVIRVSSDAAIELARKRQQTFVVKGAKKNTQAPRPTL